MSELRKLSTVGAALDAVLLGWQQKVVARLKREGATTTFSLSVSVKMKARLRRAANRAFGGKVSALIEAIALEADRREALDWLLQRAPAVDDEAYEDFMREMAGTKRKRSRTV